MQLATIDWIVIAVCLAAAFAPALYSMASRLKGAYVLQPPSAPVSG
jgi:hypothetical protein